MPATKIKNLNALKRLVGNLKAKGKRIVFTNGCFDILHPGHISLLRRSRAAGDVLIVGLNSDRSVRRIKGKGRPVNSQAVWAKNLTRLKTVNYLTVFNATTPLKIIKTLKPDVLVKGTDWQAGEIVGAKFIISRGGKVVRMPLLKGYSTTAIIAAGKK